MSDCRLVYCDECNRPMAVMVHSEGKTIYTCLQCREIKKYNTELARLREENAALKADAQSHYTETLACEKRYEDEIDILKSQLATEVDSTRHIVYSLESAEKELDALRAERDEAYEDSRRSIERVTRLMGNAELGALVRKMLPFTILQRTMGGWAVYTVNRADFDQDAPEVALRASLEGDGNE